MKKKDLENRIKELELELSNQNASKYDVQKSLENEQRFHNLIEQSIYPILIFKGEDMILEIANAPMLKVFNVGKEAFGKPFLDILPEMKDQPFMGLLLDVLHNGVMHYGKEQPAYFERENGVRETIYFNFVYHPHKEIDGTVSGVIVNATDVTELVLARQKAEESEARFRSLVMQAPVAIGIYKGKEYIAEAVNELSLQMLSKGVDFVGKPLFDVLPELEKQGFKHLMDAVMQSGITYYGNEIEFYINKNNISTLGYYNFIIQQLKDDDKIATGIIVVANEVTEQVLARQKVEESEHRYHSMVYTSPSMIAIFRGEDMIIDIANDSILESWGKGKDIIGKSLFEVMPETIEQGFDKLLHSVYKTGEPIHAHETPVTLLRNGKQELMHYTFIYQAQRNVLGEIEGVAVLANEVTPQVEAKIKIMEYANELKHAKELAELATLKAEEAVKFKQQFLSNMSHEIRTPLNSILGFTNVLLKTELGEKQKDFVQAIKTSSHSLTSLINDILDLAKVDAGKVTFVKQPFDMQKSIKSIVHFFDLKIKEKNLKLVSEYDSAIPAIVVGDSVRLNQIILNLMSNAIKFTHKGKIALNIKQLSEDEENVSIQFTISDTGIGIADNKIDLIFNLFEQADISTSSSYGGTGLGLAIVKQLIEFQGGSISVSSKIGEGSTFSFMLPFGKTNMKTEEETETLKLDSKIKNLRVLVAEDVALNQLLIKIILSDFGFEHDVVNNGKMAIEKLQTNTYDIILMDLQMPEMNGFEATEYIRKTMKSNIPIIALTADVTTVDIDKCKEFGMDDYLSKPIIENQLYSKIVELVKKATIIID